MLCARIAEYTPLRNELTISQTVGHCDAMAATVFHNLLKGEFHTHPLITLVARLVDAATAGAQSLAHICNIVVPLSVNCHILCLLSCKSALLSKAAPPLNPLCQSITPIFKTECDDCVDYVGGVLEVQVHLSVLVQCLNLLNERQTILIFTCAVYTHTVHGEQNSFSCAIEGHLFGWCKLFLNWSTQLWCMRFANMEFSGLGMTALSLLEAIPSSGGALRMPGLPSYPLMCILPCPQYVGGQHAHSKLCS